jgi:hypothetical protein
MKHFFTKISILSLSFLVLFSTFSFTVDAHYCGDFLVDFSLIGKTNSCGMQMDGGVNAVMKSCCKDEVQKIEGQEELQNQEVQEFTFKEQQFVAIFYITYRDLFIEQALRNKFYKDFTPPDIPIDYQVQYQTFLI